MSEYGEPWKTTPFGGGAIILAQDEREVLCNLARMKDAERIVSCVSALADIPNPEAVRELVEAVRIPFELEDGMTHADKKRIQAALAALSAPSPGAQQK